MGKITRKNIYIYIFIYIYVYIPWCVPPSTMEVFFLQKVLPKKLFMGRFLGKIYGEGYMEGLMIRSNQGRGEQNAFSKNL